MRTQTLKSADYTLLEQPASVFTPEKDTGVSVIETKRSITEIAGNLVTDRGIRNFTAELDRLHARYRYSHLFVEGGLNTLLGSDPLIAGVPPPGIVCDLLLRLTLPRGILLHLVEQTPRQRRLAAEYAARLLLNSTLSRPRETPDALSSNPRQPAPVP